MLNKFFSKFIDPMGIDDTSRPPSDVFGFFKYYLKPIRGVLITTLLLSGIATVSELMLYVYLGDIVDWMGSGNPATFFQEHKTALIWMLVVAVIIRPIALLLSRGMISFALVVGLGNRIRWHNHRYVLRQSLSYFQNDFAGRVAQKVMQTGNSAREAVINVIDGLWLLVVYLIGITWLFVDMDWRLLMPMVLWIAGYSLVILFLVPSVRGRSANLSEANSRLLGQIVDGYTNIQSVKLFASDDQEDAYAGGFLKRHTTAFRSLMESIFNMTVALTVLNTALVVGTAVISIILWQRGEVSVGTIAIANALIMRVNQMSGWILRTITSLFEQMGTVQNGIATISKPNSVMDVAGAKPLILTQSKITFESMSFYYSDDNRVIENFDLALKPGEKVGVVGRSGAGKSTLVNLLLRFYDVDKGAVRVDQHDIKQLDLADLRHAIGLVSTRASGLKSQFGTMGKPYNAGIAAALRLDDPAFLHYRDAAFQIARAGQAPGETPIWDFLLSFTTSSEDPISGGRHKVLGSKRLNIPPQTSTIASHLPKAVGAAYSVNLARQLNPEHRQYPDDAGVLCSFGDASLNHSTAQGALNTAGWTAYQNIPLPIIFYETHRAILS